MKNKGKLLHEIDDIQSHRQEKVNWTVLLSQIVDWVHTLLEDKMI